MSRPFQGFALCVSIACAVGLTDPARAQLDLPAGASVGTSDVVSAAGLASGTWQQISPPDGRYGHTAVFDPKGRRMIVFGGFDHVYLNDTWVFTLDDSLWHRLATVGLPPSPRAYHTAIYDPKGNRMIVFGGSGQGPGFADVWVLTLGDGPEWFPLHPAGSSPGPRTGHSAVYDPVRDQMIVFGGFSEDLMNDVWTLSLRFAPTWTEVVPEGTPPSGRFFHSAVYQDFHHRMIVFGGNDAHYRNDVWTLSIKPSQMRWSQLSPAGTPPIARGYATAVLEHVPQPEPGGSATALEAGVLSQQKEIVDDRLVIFGGYNGVLQNDSWALTVGEAGEPAWTKLQPTGDTPKRRRSAAAIFDPVRNRMLLFSGNLGNIPGSPQPLGSYADVLALNLEGSPSWTAVAPCPIAALGVSSIFDPVRRRMILFGGQENGGAVPVREVWSYSLDGEPRWSLINHSGSQSFARSFATAIYDPLGDRMLVYGGDVNGVPSNELWELTLGDAPRGRRLLPNGPSRATHVAVYDPVRHRMIVFGGIDPSLHAAPDDVWALSLDDDQTWTRIVAAGTGPGPTSNGPATAIYDPARDRMIVACNCGLWGLSLSGTPTWTRIRSSAVACRSYAQSVLDPVRDRMIVFAGASSGGTWYRDTWGIPLSGGPENLLVGTPPGRPEPTIVPAMVYDEPNDRLVMYHPLTLITVVGLTVSIATREVWTLPLSSPAALMASRPAGSGASGGADAERPSSAGAAGVNLSMPYPNPARAGASFALELPHGMRVTAAVLDLAGRRVATLADGELGAGSHQLHWSGRDADGSTASAGLYFCQVVAGGVRLQRAVVVIP